SQVLPSSGRVAEAPAPNLNGGPGWHHDSHQTIVAPIAFITSGFCSLKYSRMRSMRTPRFAQAVVLPWNCTDLVSRYSARCRATTCHWSLQTGEPEDPCIVSVK